MMEAKLQSQPRNKSRAESCFAGTRKSASRLFAWRWPLGFSLFALLVLFKIHGVSLESWNDIVKDITPAYRYRSVGDDRRIRSDEYAVAIPLAMAQCEHPDFFPRVNDRCGVGGMDMFVSVPPNPVWDWTVVGQAANWGYFLFGFERGLAWNWWARYLLGFLFAMEFFLIWLQKDRAMSFVAALAVTLGAPTQWWTTTVPYLNLFFFASLVFLNKLFSWRRKSAQVAAATGLAVSLCSFSFSFYPPFQFLYGVALLLLGGEMVRLACRSGEKRPRKIAWVMLVCVMGALVGEWGYFFAVHHETLSRLATSAYPGDRLCLGGDLKSFLEMQVWKIVSLFSSSREVGFHNACVVSVFFVPLAAAALASSRVCKLRIRESPVLVWVGAWAFVMMFWMAFRWPEALARATFFSQVKIERAAVVSSFLLLLLVFKVAQLALSEKRPFGFAAVAGCLIFSFGGLALSFSMDRALPAYFTDNPSRQGMALLALGATLLVIVTIGLLRYKRQAFLGGYAAIALLSGAFVNPVSQGAAPLTHKQLGEAVHAVVREHGDGLWLCHSPRVAQYVLAQGLASVNCVQQTADPEIWRRVDPDEAHMTVWNRYAHVAVSIVPAQEVAAVLYPNTADLITWRLDETAIRALGVRYLLWSGKKIREPWVEYLGRSRLHFIYKVSEPENPEH